MCAPPTSAVEAACADLICSVVRENRPGSHKVAFDLPEEWRNARTQADMPDCVAAVGVNAGDVSLTALQACARNLSCKRAHAL